MFSGTKEAESLNPTFFKFAITKDYKTFTKYLLYNRTTPYFTTTVSPKLNHQH